MGSSLHIAGLSRSEVKGQPRAAAATLHVTHDGVEGDRHAGPGPRQVSMIHERVVRACFPDAGAEELAARGRANVLLGGDGLAELRLLDTLELDGVALEITEIGSAVNASGEALCNADSRCLLSGHGVFGRVLREGRIAGGVPVHHRQRQLHARVITVSDRASSGDRDDTSGPAIEALLREWCAEHHWTLRAESRIIPDDREAIASVLDEARHEGTDVVITTGGTGVGPRDITPDVVADHADKLIPGIMDHIRLKHGARMPMALTSRSVAAVSGTGLVYTLPGSPKAVPEYLHEIFKTMGHMILLLKGIDPHG